MLNNKKFIIVVIILIFILGIGVYANSLNGKFIWDDNALVKKNVYIRHWSNAPKIFIRNVGDGAAEMDGYYRPLQNLTYMLDYSLWRLNVRGYHLTNILIHIMVVLSLFWMVSLLWKDKVVAFFASTIYLVHPAHVETVSYISGRGGSLVALFMILSFIFYVKYIDAGKGRNCLFMLIFAALALLSKENCLVLPALFLLYNFSFKKRFKALPLFSVSVLVILYLLFRVFLSGPSLIGGAGWLATLPQRLPGVLAAITGYMRILIIPVDLHFDYGTARFGITDPVVILGAIILAGIMIAVFKKTKGDNLVLFAGGWFFITLLPVSNIYPLSFYMSEHYLYLPSIGFFLILAMGLKELYASKRNLSIAAWMVLLVSSSVLTIDQNNYWKDPMRFYEKTLGYGKDNPNIYINLGYEYRERGRNEEAISMFNKAIALSPESVSAHMNMAISLYQEARYDDAIVECKRALEIDPEHAPTHLTLALSYYGDLDMEKAIEHCKRAIELNGDYADAYYDLGIFYEGTGSKEEALECYRKAVEIDPGHAGAYGAMAIIYVSDGRYDQAMKAFVKAVESDPGSAAANMNLAVAYYNQGRYDLAVQYCDRAALLGQEVDPSFLKLIDERRK